MIVCRFSVDYFWIIYWLFTDCFDYYLVCWLSAASILFIEVAGYLLCFKNLLILQWLRVRVDFLIWLPWREILKIACAGSRFEFQQYHRSGTEVIWLKIIIFVCNCLMLGLLFASCRSYLNRKQSRIEKQLRHLASISDNLDFLAACSLPEVRHTEKGILNTSSFIQCLPEKLGQEGREASSAYQSLKNALWLLCMRSNYAESKLRFCTECAH